jgi:putative toxin-antitoxin system antitoxin component (TIGR02293 family)
MHSFENAAMRQSAAKRTPISRTKPSPSRETKGRLADIETSGLGNEQDDLAFFVSLDPIEQAGVIRDGMDASIVQRIAREWLDVPVKQLLASLRLPASTIARKITQGERLNSGEADLAARTLLIYAQAKDVFEDASAASTWLKVAHIELRGERPIDMIDTQSGYDRVRDILMKIEYGTAV